MAASSSSQSSSQSSSSASSSASRPTGSAPRVKKPQKPQAVVGGGTCWVVIGPAGTGKSTIAKHLATAIGAPFIEGDDWHPPANISKMSAGIPLTDNDRWGWLDTLRDVCISHLKDSADVVLTCSALKRAYRNRLRGVATSPTSLTSTSPPTAARSIRVRFIYLDAPEDLVMERAQARQGHFMGANMVRSQYKILEPPTEDGLGDVIRINAAVELKEVLKEVERKVGKRAMAPKRRARRVMEEEKKDGKEKEKKEKKDDKDKKVSPEGQDKTARRARKVSRR